MNRVVTPEVDHHMKPVILPSTARQWAVVVTLVILASAGLWAIGQRMAEGMKVTNLTSGIPWGIWVAFYIYSIGLSAGSFLMSTIVYVFGDERFEKMGRMALLSALFALVTGMIFIWMDLGHPWRFWKILSGWQASSVLAWESLFYVFYSLAICTELWLLMRCDLDRLARTHTGFMGRFYRFLSLGWRCPDHDSLTDHGCRYTNMRWVRFVGMIGVPLAIGVHGGTGALFAVVMAKPYWFSGLFPIIFLVSALVSGCGLMLFLYAFWGRRDDDYPLVLDGLKYYLTLFIVVDVLLFISDLLVNFYGNIPDHVEALRAIMFGDYWYVFWLGQIGLAWLLPILLCTLPQTSNRAGWLGTAGLSVVAGIVAVRLNLVIPAYIVPQLPGLEKAVIDPRLMYHYYPSITEWVSSIGLFALVTLGLMLSWRILPLYEAQEEVEEFERKREEEYAKSITTRIS